MIKITNQGIIIFSFVLITYLTYRLAPILTPFLLGALLAYVTNPFVHLLQKLHLSHLLSVVLTFLLLLSIIFLLIFMFVPIVHQQILVLIDIMPQIVYWIEDTLFPWLNQTTDMATIKSALSNIIPNAGTIISTMLNSSVALIEIMVNIILTPIVYFYFLRDGNKLSSSLTQLIPKSSRATVIILATQCDNVLHAFFRGQFLVMLSLIVIYGIGLTIVGLNIGLTIALIGGILSVVPYMGSTFILIASIATALVQYGSWHAIVGVIIVFLIGQSLESYVLTPYLVGNRIGLHPIVVIFSILAGGTLFGFFGILLALPVSAVIKVLLQFFRKKYIAA